MGDYVWFEQYVRHADMGDYVWRLLKMVWKVTCISKLPDTH